MNFFFQSSKIRQSFLTILSVVVLSISLFGALSVSAQSTVKDDFNNFDEVYKEKAKQCAKSALIQMVVTAVLSMAGTQVPTIDWPASIKETIQDCLIWAFKAALIETLSMGTVKFVQTGFDGNPAFVQSIGDYMREISNGVAGSFIEDNVPFLCSPFQLQIKLALTNMYRQSQGLGYNPSCTLSDAVENIQGYLAGDFESGGWNGWYEFISNPYNSPLGSIMETSQQLSLRVNSQKGTAQVKLNLGSGFFGKEEQTCYAFQSLEDEEGTPFKLLSPKETVQEALTRLGLKAPGGTECDDPKIITPGETIKSNLEQAFATNLDNIVSADELNEIINLAIGYLTYHVLVGEGGLAGYKSEDFPYEGDYQPGVDPNAGQCNLEITEGEPGRGGQLVNEPAPFTSTASDPFREITIDVPPGQNYSRVRAEFDLTTAPQTAPPNASQLNLFWFHRGPNIEQSEWGANDIAEVVLNAENGMVRFASSVNSCEMLEHSERSPFRDNLTYHVVVDYNPGAGTMSVSANGSTIVSQATTVDVLQSGDQHDRGGFFIKLGGAENASADEGLTDGFTWSNLTVNFTPGEATTGGGGGEQDPPPPPPQEDEIDRVFIDDHGTPGKNELYTESTSGVVNKISGQVQSDGDVTSYKVSEDGTKVVFTGDVITDGTVELFSVPIQGGTRTKLSQPLDYFENVLDYHISPNSQYVAFTADALVDQQYEMFSVPITGGTVRRIGSAISPDYDVEGMRWSLDSQRIVYRIVKTALGKAELFSTPYNSLGGIRIGQDGDEDPDGNGVLAVMHGGFEVSCNSQRVYFRADRGGAGSFTEYFSVPITGGVITSIPGPEVPASNPATDSGHPQAVWAELIGPVGDLCP